MSDARPIILGLDEDRARQSTLAPIFNAAGLTYRFITDRKKLIGGCTQLKPDILVVYGELSSDFVIACLDTLAHDITHAKLPVIVSCSDLSDANFVVGLRSSVVGLIPAPFDAINVQQVRAIWEELSTRAGSVSGVADGKTLSQLVDHIRRTRRTGVLVIDPRTPSEGKATFVKGRLERAKFLGAGAQDAMKAMIALPHVRWSFSEVAGKHGDGAGVVIEFGDTSPADEHEIEIVTGEILAPAEDEPMAFELPKAPPPPPPSIPVQAIPATAGARVRMLLVDDDEAILRMFSTLFAKHGFDVTTATDGQQGVEATVANDFDAVLADLNMPHLDGWGMLRMLRDDFRTRELPVAFISAHDDYRESLRALNAGAQAYFSKGTRLDALLNQVKKLLEPREAARDELTQKREWNVSIATVGPQWLLRELERRQLTGVLTAKDGWASYVLVVNAGVVVNASATAGKFKAEGDRAFNAFVASRAAEGVWKPGAIPTVTPNLGASTSQLITAACETLNANEQRLRDDLMVSAKEIEVSAELYAVYREVGPKQWLEAARLICEEKVPPREIIARLDMSPIEIEDTLRDLVRRGVVTLKSA